MTAESHPLEVLPTCCSDESVLFGLRRHLRKHDERFRRPRRGDRMTQQATEAGRAVLAWWRDRGCLMVAPRGDLLRSACDAVAGSVSGLLVMLLGQWALTWVAKLVVELLVDWLLSRGSEGYRSSAAARAT